MKGKIKFFNEKKNFGFIAGDDGKDYFVHRTALPKNADLTEDTEVVFEPTTNDKGNQALNVEIV